MQISFDLDGTLIPFNNEFETENRSFVAKLLGIEPLRKGTQQLFADLKKQGHQIHLYTTSHRKVRTLRIMFWYYCITVGQIINEPRNRRSLKSHNIKASKYPPAFGFDIHIDDSEGVGQEGQKFNFRTIIITSKDHNWEEKIINNI